MNEAWTENYRKVQALKTTKVSSTSQPADSLWLQTEIKHYSRSQGLLLPCCNTKSPEKQNPLTILRKFSVAINYGQTGPLLSDMQNDIKICDTDTHWSLSGRRACNEPL